MLCDGDFLTLGDALKKLGKMGFGVESADRGPRPAYVMGGCGHIIQTSLRLV
jgi:hypothetical protein